MNPTNPDIRKGGIYAFISPQFGSWSAYDPSGHLLNQGMITLKANIVQAEKDGQAVFRVERDTQPYRLLASADAQRKALQPHLNRISVWTAEEPAPSLLLELTGKFGPDAYKVLPPGSWK